RVRLTKRRCRATRCDWKHTRVVASAPILSVAGNEKARAKAGLSQRNPSWQQVLVPRRERSLADLQPTHAGSKPEYARAGIAGQIGGDHSHPAVIEEVPHEREHVFARALRVGVVWKMSGE